MKFMHTRLLVAACAVTMSQMHAIPFPHFFQAPAPAPVVEAVVVPQAPVVKSISARAAERLAGVKDACAALLARAMDAAKHGSTSVVTSLAHANESVDQSVIAKAPWFKDHANVLTASKVVVASAVLAVTGYMVKKAYNAVKACRSK
jgi:hypothetical protein